MSGQQLIEFEEEELNLEEAPQDVVQEKPRKTKAQRKKKVNLESNQAEPKVEPADAEDSTQSDRHAAQPEGSEVDEQDSGDRGEAIGAPAVQSTTEVVDQNSWHTNVLGTPKGSPNPYFQGVVALDTISDKQALIPFERVKSVTRVIYVDDIHNANPVPLATIYRIMGDFREVIAQIDESVFKQIEIGHPQLKRVKINYQIVSDHINPRWVYSFSHGKWPSQAEIQKQDKEIEQYIISRTPEYQREQRKGDSKVTLVDVIEDEPASQTEDEPEVG